MSYVGKEGDLLIFFLPPPFNPFKIYIVSGPSKGSCLIFHYILKALWLYKSQPNPLPVTCQTGAEWLLYVSEIMGDLS